MAIDLVRRNRWSKARRREAIEGYLFISPWLIGFFVFTAGPIVASLLLSFMRWSIVQSPEWVGLANYRRALFNDRYFWQSLKVTSLYTVLHVPLGLFGALMVALLMNQKVKGILVFRTIYYLPAVLSGVAVSLLWAWIFNPDYGLVNFALWKLFRIHGPAWLASEQWVLPAFIIMGLWGIGGGMVINLAGLQGIPTELYEAAKIDGAGWWSEFWRITIPMLSPVLFFNLIMGIIGSFQVFTQAYVMTAGGPNNASLFYVLYLYQNAFEWFKMGYSSALAWFLFLIILLCTILVFKSSPFWVYYEAKKGR